MKHHFKTSFSGDEVFKKPINWPCLLQKKKMVLVYSFTLSQTLDKLLPWEITCHLSPEQQSSTITRSVYLFIFYNFTLFIY